MPIEIIPPTALKYIQKEKTIQLGQNLTCANLPKEARAQCAVCASQQIPQSAQCAKCVIVYDKIRALL
jgi:hypothetical protein